MRTIVAVAAVFCVSRSAGAQPFMDLQPYVGTDRTVFADVRPTHGSRSERLEGSIADLSPTTLSLLVKGERRNLREPDVIRIFTRETRARKGAAIGLAVGGLVGLWFDRLLVRSECGVCPAQWQNDDLLVVGLAAGAGGLFGASIGGSMHRDDVLFQSRRH